MNTGKDLTKKIAKKKLNEVVELDEPKTTHTGGMFDDLEDDLFSNPAEHPALAKLKEIDPDSLTPRAALDLLYELRKQF